MKGESMKDNNINILAVEDSEEDYILILRHINKQFESVFAKRVETQEDLENELSHPWDLVISDYSLPGLNGLEVLKKVRSVNSDLPFILISGTIGEILAVEAMRLGANDYVMKDNLSRLGTTLKRELREYELKKLSKKSEERYNELLTRSKLVAENIQDLVCLHKRDLSYQWVSPSIKQLSGYTPEELTGKNPTDFIHNDDVGQLSGALMPMIEGKVEKAELTYRVRTKNGEYIWLETNAKPIYENGKITQILSTSRDITDRKIAYDLLSQSESRYYSVIESLTEGVMIFDHNGRMVSINASAKKTLEYKQYSPETTHRNIMAGFNIFDGESQPISFEDLPSEVSLKTGKSYTNFIMGLEKNGKINWLSVNSSCYAESAGKRGVVVSFKEITEDLIIQQKMRESEAKYRKITNNIPGVVIRYRLTTEGKDEFLFVSKNIEEIYEISQIEAQKNVNLIWDKVHHEDKQELKNNINISAKNQAPWSCTHRIVVNNETKWVNSFGIPEKQEDGSTTWDTLIFDITNQKETEEKVTAIAQELTNIIDTANAPIFGVDYNGNINEWNQVCAKITGYSKNEVLGLNLIKDFLPENYQVLVTDIFKSALRGKNQSNYEIPILTKPGNRVIILLNATPRKNIKGDIIGVFAVGQNITELTEYREQLEQKVQERTKKLNDALSKEKELVAMKSKFVSMASHEFRTPLSTITFIADYIRKYKDKLSEEKFSGKLCKIDEQVKHMTHLLDDILVMGKSEAGKIKLNKADLLIKDFIKSIKEEVEHSAINSHRIMYSVASEHKVIHTDEKLLRNILINLLTNSIKFSPGKEKVLLDVICSHGKLIMIVKDWGMGIAKEDQEKVFEAFHRTNNVGTIQGTGLGLSIMKKAVDLLSGDIDLTSNLGEGTTFKVTIPLDENTYS